MNNRTRPADKPKLRMTRQRRMICRELAKAADHPTADEVYSRVRRRLPRISLGTVYRNLEILSACGTIQKLRGGSRMRFDAETGPHSHVRCLHCGRVADVATEPAANLEARAEKASGYEIVGHRLEFVGLCPTCGDKKRQAGKTLPISRRKTRRRSAGVD